MTSLASDQSTSAKSFSSAETELVGEGRFFDFFKEREQEQSEVQATGKGSWQAHDQTKIYVFYIFTPRRILESLNRPIGVLVPTLNKLFRSVLPKAY